MATEDMVIEICEVESMTGCVNCTLYELCKLPEKHEIQIEKCYKEWKKERLK